MPTDLGAVILGTVEHTIEDRLPSPLKPYAKALISALPPVLAAYSAMQAGSYTAVTVLQFVLAVITTLSVYFVPALPIGKWQAGSKTIVAAVGAILAAGIAGFGGGGAEGWLGFASAALAAVLVEVVDNVPNAAPAIGAALDAADDVIEGYRQGGYVASTTAVPQSSNVQLSFKPIAKAQVPLPGMDEVDPEG